MVDFLNFRNWLCDFQFLWLFIQLKHCSMVLLLIYKLWNVFFLLEMSPYYMLFILDSYWVSQALIQFNDYVDRMETPDLRVVNVSATQSNNFWKFVRYLCIFIFVPYLPSHCNISLSVFNMFEMFLGMPINDGLSSIFHLWLSSRRGNIFAAI